MLASDVASHNFFIIMFGRSLYKFHSSEMYFWGVKTKKKEVNWGKKGLKIVECFISCHFKRVDWICLKTKGRNWGTGRVKSWRNADRWSIIGRIMRLHSHWCKRAKNTSTWKNLQRRNDFWLESLRKDVILVTNNYRFIDKW